MSVVNGQLTTCERCGKQVFRKTIGEGDADGGFTRWNKFEPYPDGWGSVCIPRNDIKTGYVMVCPECSAEWRKALNKHFVADTYLDVKE